MKKALVIGSLNMDMTVKVEELPKLGETIFGDDFYEEDASFYDLHIIYDKCFCISYFC